MHHQNQCLEEGEHSSAQCDRMNNIVRMFTNVVVDNAQEPIEHKGLLLVLDEA